MKKVTHNQQVLGSSPSWATLIPLKALIFKGIFFIGGKIGEN